MNRLPASFFARSFTSRASTNIPARIPVNFFSLATVATCSMAKSGDQFPARPYESTYDAWPYSTSDFQRYDESEDSGFYGQPRFVTHIDDPAIARLTAYYDTVMPKKGRILDLCTSWRSFYPSKLEEGVKNGELEVFGVGLNAQEMDANPVFRDRDHWRVLDLNKSPHDPSVAWSPKEGNFDAVTCVVSIDYLSNPLEVCRSLLRSTRDDGSVHLVISNRCFPTKVIKRWLALSEQGRLELVGDYLHFSGWSNVEIVDLCACDETGKRTTDDQGTVTVESPRMPSHLDPLWVVRAKKAQR